MYIDTDLIHIRDTALTRLGSLPSPSPHGGPASQGGERVMSLFEEKATHAVLCFVLQAVVTQGPRIGRQCVCPRRHEFGT